MHRSIYFLLFIAFSCSNAPKSATVDASTATGQLTAPAPVVIPHDAAMEKHVMGLFDPAEDPRFVLINPSHADKKGLYLHQDTYGAFLKMYGAARSAGIELQIRSATRNFDYQKGIWERKWTGETILSNGEDASKVYPNSYDRAKKILEYSSMPGTSRHHWGTDIDLNNFNNSWFESGEGLVLFNWLEANAHKYGFCRPYTLKDASRPDGYNEEKWHWSYTPLANKLTAYAEAHLEDKMITGFMGSEVADSLDVVQKYVLGINRGCVH